MDIFRKILGTGHQPDAQQAAGSQPPAASSASPRMAASPQRDGGVAPNQQSQARAPVSSSPPRFQQVATYAARLPEENRPDAVVASLGGNPAPILVVNALLILWFEARIPDRGSLLEQFVEALQEMYLAIGDAGVKEGERDAARRECRERLKSLLESRLPADCQASYRQALQESARCTDSNAASLVMRQALNVMALSFRGTPTPSAATTTTATTTTATTTATATTTNTATTTTTSTPSGNVLIPHFPVLAQLRSTDAGRKAVACLNQYETMAIDSQTNICSASPAHIELNGAIFAEDKWRAVANTRVYSSLPQKTALRIAAERDCRYRRQGELHDAELNRKLLGCRGNAHADTPEAHQPGNEVSIALHAPLLVAPGTVVKPVILQFPASSKRNALLARQSPDLLLTAHKTTLQALARHTLQCVHDNPGKGVVLTAYGAIESIPGLNEDQKKRLQKATAEEFAKLVKALHAAGVEVSYAEASAHSGFWDEVQIALGDAKVPMSSVGKLPNASLDGKIVVVTGSSTTLVGSGWEDGIQSAGAAIGEHSLVQTIHAGFCAAINAGMRYEKIKRIGEV